MKSLTRSDCIGRVFVAPASYFIENSEGQVRDNFKNNIFQYNGMVLGIIEEVNTEYERFLVSFKAPDNHYAEPVLTFSIPLEVDPEMFHYVKSVKRTDFYQFLLIKERDIIDIIINKDYD